MTGACRREEGAMRWRNESCVVAGIMVVAKGMKKRLLKGGWVLHASCVPEAIPCSSLEIRKKWKSIVNGCYDPIQVV